MTSRSTPSTSVTSKIGAPERNEVVLKLLGKPDRVGYGSAEIEKVDIYKTGRPNAPVMIYLHGGAWRSGRSAQGARALTRLGHIGGVGLFADLRPLADRG